MKVEIIKLKNRLLEKLGVEPRDEALYEIPDEAIREADRLVEKMKEQCPGAIRGYLAELTEAWETMRDLPDNAARAALSERVFTLAHEIKDLGSMAGADLEAYFAESLRDYVGETELNLEAQRVIIQAHVDALTIICNGNLEDGGGQAEQLKQMVKIAIEKYK